MIVAFSGRSKAGKTTAAMFLTANYNFVRRGFADGLRRTVSTVFGLTTSQLQQYKDIPLATGKTPRHYLLEVGKMFREIDPTVWIRLWESEMNYLATDYPRVNVTVDDLRFKNEYDHLKKKGAVFVRVNRSVKAVTDEPSEVELDEYEEQGKFDYIISNTSTLTEFYDNVSKLAGSLLISQYVKNLSKDPNLNIST